MDTEEINSMFPFSGLDFSSTSLNLYYSSETTAKAVASLFLKHSDASNNPQSFQQHEQSGKNAAFFCDLGCGDGRLVIEMARTFGVFCLGIDIDPKTIEQARERAYEENMGHLTSFIVGDVTRDPIPDSVVWVSTYLPTFVLKDVVKGPIENWLDDKISSNLLRFFI
jgi:ubiquinone/menaquinone biosynthesis C-methylase UbiE